MATAQELFDSLKVEVDRLRTKFLSQWLPAVPEHSPEEFEHDVKAYCVLTHAIFEEFVEEISLIGMNEGVRAWNEQRPTKGTIALICAYDACLAIPDKEEEDQEDIFTQVRKALDLSREKHSHTLSNNHGFSLRYLRKILSPVGLDVPEDVRLLESLRNLADARGSFAHTQAKRALYGKWKQANKPMTPEQAEIAINDCIDLCQELVRRMASLMLPEPKLNIDGSQQPTRRSRLPG